MYQIPRVRRQDCTLWQSFGSALACGALAMCAMWVGFSSFFAGGRKKQNKFPSNLYCTVKKLNPFYR